MEPPRATVGIISIPITQHGPGLPLLGQQSLPSSMLSFAVVAYTDRRTSARSLNNWTGASTNKLNTPEPGFQRHHGRRPRKLKPNTALPPCLSRMSGTAQLVLHGERRGHGSSDLLTDHRTGNEDPSSQPGTKPFPGETCPGHQYTQKDIDAPSPGTSRDSLELACKFPRLATPSARADRGRYFCAMLMTLISDGGSLSDFQT